MTFDCIEEVGNIKLPVFIHIYLNNISAHEFPKQEDNLKIEEGSFKLLKSEYKRSFKNFFDALKAINGAEVIKQPNI